MKLAPAAATFASIQVLSPPARLVAIGPYPPEFLYWIFPPLTMPPDIVADQAASSIMAADTPNFSGTHYGQKVRAALDQPGGKLPLGLLKTNLDFYKQHEVAIQKLKATEESGDCDDQGSTRRLSGLIALTSKEGILLVAFQKI